LEVQAKFVVNERKVLQGFSRCNDRVSFHSFGSKKKKNEYWLNLISVGNVAQGFVSSKNKL
jgi:hypothetical protein